MTQPAAPKVVSINGQAPQTASTRSFGGTGFWGAVIGAGVQIAGGIMASNAADKQSKALAQAKAEEGALAFQQQLQLNALEHEQAKELLALRASLGGGGGGGVDRSLTDAERLAALNNMSQNRSRALETLIAGFQRALKR